MDEVTRSEMQELGAKVSDLKKDVAEVLKLTKDKVVAGTTEWTKAHPLAALAIAAGLGASIGFGIGLLVGRNKG